jgi:HEAT repeat protein
MEAVAPLLDDPVGLVSIAVLETLGEVLGEQACPLLLPALAHPDAEVVNVALDLLSRHATAAWLTVNAEALANHPSGIVRGRSALLLAVLAGAGVRPVLERRLAVETETTVRQQLADALAELAGF